MSKSLETLVKKSRGQLIENQRCAASFGWPVGSAARLALSLVGGCRPVTVALRLVPRACAARATPRGGVARGMGGEGAPTPCTIAALPEVDQ